jgi:hypothetical protein
MRMWSTRARFFIGFIGLLSVFAGLRYEAVAAVTVGRFSRLAVVEPARNELGIHKKLPRFH